MAIQYPSAQVVGEQPGFASTGSTGNILADLLIFEGAATIATGDRVPFIFAKKPMWTPSSHTWGPWGKQNLMGQGFWKNQLGKSLGVKSAAEAATKAGVKGAVGRLGAWGTAGIIGAGVSAAMGGMMLNILPQLATMPIEVFAGIGAQARRERRQRTYTGGLEMYGRGFFDTQAAATMRQSSMALIQESQLGVRSALSREAFFMHR